jgi:hypothetical protein
MVEVKAKLEGRLPSAYGVRGFAALSLLLAAVVGNLGCQGVIGETNPQQRDIGGTGPGAGAGVGNGSTPGGTGTGDPGSPVPTTLVARLTNQQYTNTLADLLPGVAFQAAGLPAENIVGGFENVSVAQTPSAELIEGYRATSQAVATAATTDLTKVLPCTVKASTDEVPCGTQFIGTFGKQAFRRPLTSDESTRMVSFFTTARTTYDFKTAIGMVIQAFLQAPQFLYRVQLGAAAQGAYVALTSYEMASRLSYLLWDTMPDKTLMAAADGDQLANADQMETQARRLLGDARAHASVANFHRQWLRFSKLDAMVKDPTAFPQWSAAMDQAMIDSAKQFVDHEFWDQGTLDSFLTDNHVYVNDVLAPVYGLPAPGTSQLTLVAADATQRAGIMTQAGLLAGFAHEVFDSPVLRGVFVLDRLLCAAPAPPPPGVNLTLPSTISGPQTTRQMFENGHEQGACAGCHKQIDGIGFGFESYDAIGKWRTTDNGQPVDHTGTVTGTADLNGPYDGAVELANKMAKSEGVQSCVASKWLGYALGLETVPSAALQPVAQGFIASGRNFQELLVELVRSDAFRLRPASTP